MSVSVYKIKRSDGLEYVGITSRPNIRFKEHKRSKRFKVGIDDITILAKVNTYEEAEDLEEMYIDMFDTFENGLNVTSNGRGKNPDCKFNTLGYEFSKDSRIQMSHSAKRRGSKHLVEYVFTDEDKKKMSNTRKGIYWGANEKISEEQSKQIYNSYMDESLMFDQEFIMKFVKSSQKNDIDKLPFSELRSKNGKPLNNLTLYCHYYADKYGVTHQNIRRIINNKGTRSPSCHSIKY